MIRATVVSTIDQALLSALNFGLAFLLIHLTTKDDYGLYAQLINLQSFFSPVHAGVFVSAYLAMASKLNGGNLSSFRASIARSEIAVSLLSGCLVVTLCSVGGQLFGLRLSVGTCLAFGLSLIGLWWREFIRTTQFTQLLFQRALRVDATYCAATVAAAALLAATGHLSVGAIFWCLAAGAIVATAAPLLASVRAAPVDAQSVLRDLRLAWSMGRWDVLGSVVSWGYQQSYVYFAALHGGLDGAAEISAARLLVTPMALMWTSYANVLRPRGSQLLAASSHAALRRLAIRSSLFVIAVTAAYALIALLALPLLERFLLAGKFRHLGPLMMCWTIYICLTGLTTVASSVLRSALEFRQIFNRQVISCVAAIALLAAASSHGALSIVAALSAVEAISVIMLWHRLGAALSSRSGSILPA